MSGANIVGAAMLKMGKYPASGYAGLGAPPARAALAAAGIPASAVEAVYCGHAFGGMLTGQRIAKELGLGGIRVVNTDNACSGGATALHLATRAIQAGELSIALVVGVEKLTQFGGGTLPLPEEDPEARAGMVLPALYAMRARRYLYERDATPAELAEVSVKARRHGALNPFAQFQKEVDVDQVLSSRTVADPLTLFQCCPTGDGAAAVVVVSDEIARSLDADAIRVIASVLHSGRATSGPRDMLHPQISYDSARDAYAEAGVVASDLDMVELHDAFSIAELVYYEALGLCEEGGSLDLLKSGATTFGGDVVVNPSGGLLSKGHPVGASGVAQAVEAYWQLTGQAGSRQIADARLAMTHVTGGGISGYDHGACAVHIFERAA